MSKVPQTYSTSTTQISPFIALRWAILRIFAISGFAIDYNKL